MAPEFTVSGVFERIAPSFCLLLTLEIDPMKNLLAASLSGFLLVTANVALAGGDAAAGKAKSASCAGCHGAAGISSNPMWPNLAGQKDAYLVKQMKAFRDGQRNDPMMSPMAKPLSDADIDNLAAFYSSLK
jgi:cytochrome c553